MSEEGRRFIRYVLPGLVYFIETLLFAYIILPEQTLCFVDKHFTDLGSAVSAFLISGGLGYMFEAVHHCVFLYLPFDKKIFDHKKVITKLLNSKEPELNSDSLQRLGLKREDGKVVEDLSLSCCKKRNARMEAWTFSQSLWYHFLKSEQSGKDLSANPDKDEIDKLGQQAQGLGTARIASVFALATTVYLSVQYGTPSCGLFPIIRYVLMLTLAFGTIWMFCSGYKRVADLAHGAYTITLVNECSEEKGKSFFIVYCNNFKAP